jgi:hypothetical protein
MFEVTNDFEAEKKLYLKSVKNLKKIILDYKKNKRKERQEMENDAEAN